MTDTPTPPDGWYPDPAGGGGLRRWNGTSWTDEVRAVDGSTAAPSGESKDAAVPLHDDSSRGAASDHDALTSATATDHRADDETPTESFGAEGESSSLAPDSTVAYGDHGLTEDDAAWNEDAPAVTSSTPGESAAVSGSTAPHEPSAPRETIAAHETSAPHEPSTPHEPLEETKHGEDMPVPAPFK